MKQPLVNAALLCAVALPSIASAQEDPESRPLLPFLEEWSRQTEDMMRELMEEIGPEMERLMSDIVPQLQALTETLGGLTNYELPEILPNGDIIIRRREDAPPLPEDFMNENGAVEL